MSQPAPDIGSGFRQPVEFQRNLLLRAVLALTDPLGAPFSTVTLTTGQRLFTRESESRNVYFPLDSVISMVVALDGEEWVEALSIGRDGAIGPFDSRAFPRGHGVVVTLGGQAILVPFDEIERMTGESRQLYALLRRYVQFCGAALAQTAACSRRHPLVRQLPRWLWLAYRRAGSDIPLSSAWLASILGVTSASVAVLLDDLTQSNIIELRPTGIMVLDPRSLRLSACDCLANISRFPDD